MREHLRDLLAHAEWANAVFFHIWGKSPARDHEELRRRVGHIIGVQDGFRMILRNRSERSIPKSCNRLNQQLAAQWCESRGQITGSIAGENGNCFLKQHGACIHAFVHEHRCDAGLGLAVDDGPLDRRGAPKFG